MNRPWTALLVVATAAVFGGVIVVLSHNTKVPEAGQTPGYTIPPVSPAIAPSGSGTSTLVSTAASVSTHASSTTSAGTVSTVIAFVGDDYTHGIGGSGGSATFPALVASSLGVHDKTFYLDGAGYAKTDPNGKSYGDLVNEVIAAHPNIVVVTGGRNDRGDDPSTLAGKAAALFSALHAGLPDAKIVAAAAWWGDSTQPAVLAQVDSAISTGVTAVGGTYLDIADPLYKHADWMSDGADPNDQGYAAIAASLEPKLKALLPV